jgi:cell division protein FtsW
MMKYFAVEQTISSSPSGDHILTASIFLLTGVGLATLYSSSYAFGERFFGDGLYFISRQLLLGLPGLLAFFIAARINLERLRKVMKAMVIAALALCVLTFFPVIGVTKNGASRWIRLGSMTYQSSELVKLVLPIYLAHIFTKKTDDLAPARSGILPSVVITSLFFFVIYLQNNFSTAIFVALNALILFFLAGVRLRYFFAALVILFPLSSLLVLTREHRLRRLISFIRPEWEPQGAGYQVRSSLLTIISGGFWGKGAGQGTRKIASVPEVHSDFIFAAFAEEAGFIGVILFFTLFAVFAIRAYRGALKTNSLYKRLLCCGLTTMILSQMLLNVTVTAGFLPATGIPLPFFSAGGSSLATTLAMAGLIVNVSRTEREERYVR